MNRYGEQKDDNTIYGWACAPGPARGMGVEDLFGSALLQRAGFGPLGGYTRREVEGTIPLLRSKGYLAGRKMGNTMPVVER